MLRTDRVESAIQLNRDELFRFGSALIFIVGIMLFTIVRTDGGVDGVLLVAAAMIGGYMAMNIGANDVANNVGPAVGSHAITLTGAIIIAASFEAGGALIVGGDLVGTIKKGIIDPDLVANRDRFIWLMIAALLAAAIWLNFATAIGAPVSNTHSIVGGVPGAGIAASGCGGQGRDAAPDEAGDGHQAAGQTRTQGPGPGAPDRTGQTRAFAAHRGGMGDHGAGGRIDVGDVLFHDPRHDAAMTAAACPKESA